MTYEEAYKILTEHTRNYVGLKDAEALEVAIKSLEHLMSKAYWYINPDGWYLQCSNCGEEPKREMYPRRCLNCGKEMEDVPR